MLKIHKFTGFWWSSKQLRYWDSLNSDSKCSCFDWQQLFFQSIFFLSCSSSIQTLLWFFECVNYEFQWTPYASALFFQKHSNLFYVDVHAGLGKGYTTCTPPNTHTHTNLFGVAKINEAVLTSCQNVEPSALSNNPCNPQ